MMNEIQILLVVLLSFTSVLSVALVVWNILLHRKALRATETLTSTFTSSAQVEDERFAYVSNHDALTGLPNRTMLFHKLEHLIASNSESNSMFNILYMDLENFTGINKTHGTQVADEVLQTISNRLRRCLGQGEPVFRLGGDEFIVVLENPRTERAYDVVCEAILKEVTGKITIGESVILPALCIG